MTGYARRDDPETRREFLRAVAPIYGWYTLCALALAGVAWWLIARGGGR